MGGLLVALVIVGILIMAGVPWFLALLGIMFLAFILGIEQ